MINRKLTLLTTLVLLSCQAESPKDEQKNVVRLDSPSDIQNEKFIGFSSDVEWQDQCTKDNLNMKYSFKMGPTPPHLFKGQHRKGSIVTGTTNYKVISLAPLAYETEARGNSFVFRSRHSNCSIDNSFYKSGIECQKFELLEYKNDSSQTNFCDESISFGTGSGKSEIYSANLTSSTLGKLAGHTEVTASKREITCENQNHEDHGMKILIIERTFYADADATMPVDSLWSFQCGRVSVYQASEIYRISEDDFTSLEGKTYSEVDLNGLNKISSTIIRIP